MGANGEREVLRARARRWVHLLYFCFIVLVVAVILVQLTAQALAEAPLPPGGVRCGEEIEGLMLAVDRARTASCKTELTEEEAVAAFRLALQPEWERAGAISRVCDKDPTWRATLDAIQYLRYAEENTVRRESSELASLRRRACQLLERNLRENKHPAHFPER
jgi:hypothetical protein